MVIMPTGGGKVSVLPNTGDRQARLWGGHFTPHRPDAESGRCACTELGVRANFLNSTLDRDDESQAIEQALLEGRT